MIFDFDCLFGQIQRSDKFIEEPFLDWQQGSMEADSWDSLQLEVNH